MTCSVHSIDAAWLSYPDCPSSYRQSVQSAPHILPQNVCLGSSTELVCGALIVEVGRGGPAGM